MRRLETSRALHPGAEDVLDRCRRADGVEPLGDHLLAALRTRHHDPVHTVTVLESEAAIAVGATAHVGGTWVIGLAVDPRHRPDVIPLATDVVGLLLDAIASSGGGHVNWWVSTPQEDHLVAAAALGLLPGRELLQMCRPLPLPDPVDLPVRAFTDADLDSWLSVNNRAFAWHDEQGGWNRATFAERAAMDWFDPADLLLHEHDGWLAGFCWTKLHRTESPPVGEIYVIGVDPDARGRGLGRRLTVAGLAHLADRGARTGMLFVDAGNVAARTLYDHLGFTVQRREQAFTVDLAPRS